MRKPHWHEALPGSLLDLVNYALSLDLAGSIAVLCGNEEGWVGFSDRHLTAAALGGHTGLEALSRIADGKELRFHLDQIGAILEKAFAFDYPGLKAWLAGRAAAPAAQDAAIPALPMPPAGLFACGDGILAFGIVNDTDIRYRCPDDGSESSLSPLLGAIPGFFDGIGRLANHIEANPWDRWENTLDFGSYFVGLMGRRDSLQAAFLVMEKPALLAHTLLESHMRKLAQWLIRLQEGEYDG